MPPTQLLPLSEASSTLANGGMLKRRTSHTGPLKPSIAPTREGRHFRLGSGFICIFATSSASAEQSMRPAEVGGGAVPDAIAQTATEDADALPETAAGAAIAGLPELIDAIRRWIA